MNLLSILVPLLPLLVSGKNNDVGNIEQWGKMRRVADEAITMDMLPEEIEEKLQHQFEKYNNGRQYLVDNVVYKNRTVSREEWEAFLRPNDGMELTEQEVETLRLYHQTLISQATHQVQQEESTRVISVDDFRDNDDEVGEFCAAFPRISLLHIHPYGTMKRETVDRLLQEINPVIDTNAMIRIGNDGQLTTLYDFEMEYLQSLTSGLRYLQYDADDQEKLGDFLFLPKDPCCHNFSRFESLFSLQDILLGQNSSYTHEILHRDFLERNKAFGISYVEFTRVRWPPSLEELVEYNDELEQWSNEFDMDLRYNVAFIRTLDVDLNIDFTRQFLDGMSSSSRSLDRVVGIDLLAEESGNPALEKGQEIYVPIWNAWQNNNNESTIQLGGMTQHAGEHGEKSTNEAGRNVRDAIIMGVTRIGHGPHVNNDPIILEYERRQKIPMVQNLVSNWRLNVVENDDYDLHPIMDLIRLGIPITLSTDDEGMFHTDIVNECIVAIQNSDIQYSELKAISYNAVSASFADMDTKDALLQQLDARFEAFEREHQAQPAASNTDAAAPTAASSTSGGVKCPLSSCWGSITIGFLVCILMTTTMVHF